MHAEQLMRDARYGYVIMMARDLRQVSSSALTLLALLAPRFRF